MNVFNILTLKHILWKTKTFFIKTGVPLFSRKRSSSENASFPYKTAMSEANVQTNRIVSTKWTFYGFFPGGTLFFWKFCFSLRTFYKELIWCTNDPNVHICTFCKSCSFIWRCFFPVSVLKSVWKISKCYYSII